MKRKTIICEEWTEEKFCIRKAKNGSKVSRCHSKAIVRANSFCSNRELVSQFSFFRLTPSLISFTQHKLFLQLPDFDFKNLR